MSVELERVSRSGRVSVEDGERETEREIPALPPTDEGPAAMKYLFGCFMIEAVLWGFPLTFGVFQDYYSKLPEFGNDPNIAVIGTIASSFFFLGAPLVSPLTKLIHSWSQQLIIFGSAICVLSLLAASFANSVGVLIATQGCLYGFGFLLVYCPVLTLLNEWFVRRRGVAYGVLYAGGGFAGVGYPFLLQWLLSEYGFRTALRGVATAQAVALAPTMLLMKGRLPSPSRSTMRVIDLEFLKNPLFWVFTVSNLLQALAYYVPSLYLPTFASSVGLSPRVGALLLAAHNLSTTVGQVGFGYLSDKFRNIHVLIFVSTFIPSLAAFCVWGFSMSIEPLLVFAIVFGCFAGSYVVYWAQFGSLLAEDPQPVYTLMAFGKGIGNIVTGPIATSLISGPVSSGYGLGRFRPLIIYLGSLMLASSMGIFGWCFRGSAYRR